MKNLIKTFSIVLAGFFFSAQADELELTILDSEYWWAGLSSKGYEMPYDQSSKVVYDLWGDNKGNQAQPLLLSNKGRYIWSEHPIKYEFNNGLITVSTRQGKIDSGRSGSNLADVFEYVSKNIFHPMVVFQINCSSHIRNTIRGLS